MCIRDRESTYRNIQEMLAQDKYYCVFPYLTAKGLSDRQFYQALAYAFNEPTSRCEYTSTGIFDIFQSEDMSGDLSLIHISTRPGFTDCTRRRGFCSRERTGIW